MFSVQNFMRALLGHRLAGLLPVLALGACTTVGPEPVEQGVEAQVTQEAERAVSSPAAEGLTEALLYQLLLSNIAFQRGEIEVASEALIEAAQLTEDPVVVARAVRMAVHSKDYPAGAELGKRWIELAGNDHQAYIITALAAVMSDQGEAGYQILNLLLDRDVAQVNLRFGQIGELFLQHAEGRVAQQVLYRLAQGHPDISEAWLVLAGMAQNNHDFAVMNLALDKVLEIEPGSEKAAAYKLLALSDNALEQAAFASTFLDTYPQANSFRMQYAQSLLRRENDSAALEQLLSLLAHDEGNAEAMNLIALLYQTREDYQNAARYFGLRVETVPDDDRSRLYLANAFQHLKRYQEAKQVLAAVSDESELFNAQRQMVQLILEADGAEAALAYLQTLRGINENQTVQLIIDQQQLLQRVGRPGEAYARINQAMERFPENSNLRYHRALVAVEQRDLAVHETDMLILLQLEPENPHYNNTLGYTLLDMTDRLEEAERLINKAHQLKPDDPYILDSKGWLEYKLGNYQSALEFLTRAYEQDRDAEIAAHIGAVYWQLGEREKAGEFWQEGDKIDAENNSLKKIKQQFLN